MLACVVVEKLAKRFYVSGRVQGVGFRFFVEHVAGQFGLSGYVKNLLDGRVEVYAIGSADQLENLEQSLRQGPRMAYVDRVQEQEAPLLAEYEDIFTIERED